MTVRRYQESDHPTGGVRIDFYWSQVKREILEPEPRSERGKNMDTVEKKAVGEFSPGIEQRERRRKISDMYLRPSQIYFADVTIYFSAVAANPNSIWFRSGGNLCGSRLSRGLLVCKPGRNRATPRRSFHLLFLPSAPLISPSVRRVVVRRNLRPTLCYCCPRHYRLSFQGNFQFFSFFVWSFLKETVKHFTHFNTTVFDRTLSIY